MPSVATSIRCSEVPEATEREVNDCLVSNEQSQLPCLEHAVLHVVFYLFFKLAGISVVPVDVCNEFAILFFFLKCLANYVVFYQN